MATTKRDYYEVLGVEHNVSEEEISVLIAGSRSNSIQTKIPMTLMPRKNLRSSAKLTMS